MCALLPDVPPGWVVLVAPFSAQGLLSRACGRQWCETWLEANMAEMGVRMCTEAQGEGPTLAEEFAARRPAMRSSHMRGAPR